MMYTVGRPRVQSLGVRMAVIASNRLPHLPVGPHVACSCHCLLAACTIFRHARVRAISWHFLAFIWAMRQIAVRHAYLRNWRHCFGFGDRRSILVPTTARVWRLRATHDAAAATMRCGMLDLEAPATCVCVRRRSVTRRGALLHAAALGELIVQSE